MKAICGSHSCRLFAQVVLSHVGYLHQLFSVMLAICTAVMKAFCGCSHLCWLFAQVVLGSCRLFTSVVLGHVGYLHQCEKNGNVKEKVNESPHGKNQQSAYAKTKAQISFAVTAKLISAFVFATLYTSLGQAQSNL